MFPAFVSAGACGPPGRPPLGGFAALLGECAVLPVVAWWFLSFGAWFWLVGRCVVVRVGLCACQLLLVSVPIVVGSLACQLLLESGHVVKILLLFLGYRPVYVSCLVVFGLVEMAVVELSGSLR